jgi:hypothetical protein
LGSREWALSYPCWPSSSDGLDLGRQRTVQSSFFMIVSLCCFSSLRARGGLCCFPLLSLQDRGAPGGRPSGYCLQGVQSVRVRGRKERALQRGTRGPCHREWEAFPVAHGSCPVLVKLWLGHPRLHPVCSHSAVCKTKARWHGMAYLVLTTCRTH